VAPRENNVSERVHLQSSNGKNRYQCDLLPASKIQGADDWDWKDDYSEISDDVYARVGAGGAVSSKRAFRRPGEHTTTSRTDQYTWRVPFNKLALRE
jgi:hypothetical protein